MSPKFHILKNPLSIIIITSPFSCRKNWDSKVLISYQLSNWDSKVQIYQCFQTLIQQSVSNYLPENYPDHSSWPECLAKFCTAGTVQWADIGCRNHTTPALSALSSSSSQLMMQRGTSLQEINHKIIPCAQQCNHKQKIKQISHKKYSKSTYHRWCLEMTNLREVMWCLCVFHSNTWYTC